MIFFAFCSLTKPADFTECVGDELPIGWEQAYDYQRGIYYVDHINSEYCKKNRPIFTWNWNVCTIVILERTQDTDPRSEWRSLQEEMLRSYLASAELDLKAKQELIDVKHQRLHIAQDEYQQLNNTLTTLSASNTSCKSSTYSSVLPKLVSFFANCWLNYVAFF